MSPSAAIRKAALFGKPRTPWLIGSWVGPSLPFDAVMARLERLEEWWDRRVSDADRRMFLLFVAEDRECIENANAAAYHGDIDGDFDY